MEDMNILITKTIKLKSMLWNFQIFMCIINDNYKNMLK